MEQTIEAGESRPVTGTRRWVYLVMPGDWEKGKGHLVRLVFENTYGYCLSGGGGKEPWYWGDPDDEEKSLILAEETALDHNLRRGLTPLDIQRIILSSMNKKNK
jgi:hypothetical protein